MIRLMNLERMETTEIGRYSAGVDRFRTDFVQDVLLLSSIGGEHRKKKEE